jgi:hypothetical protein
VKLTGLSAVAIHAEMLRNRMERAEESERTLLDIIRMYSEGSKVAESYLRSLGKHMETWP